MQTLLEHEEAGRCLMNEGILISDAPSLLFAAAYTSVAGALRLATGRTFGLINLIVDGSERPLEWTLTGDPSATTADYAFRKRVRARLDSEAGEACGTQAEVSRPALRPSWLVMRLATS